jgi:hypothetical protein
MRGTIPPDFGLMRKYAKEIYGLIKDAGMADMPVGVDYAETAMFHALQEEGLNVIDGQQIMLAAREIKNWDEIQLLTQAASMVDGVYHMIYEELKPGIRETTSSPCQTRCSTRWARTMSRRSTPFPASAATRIRTISPTAISGPVTRRSSISCSLPGLSNLLLPDVQHRPGNAVAERCLRQGARMDRRIDCNDQARRQHRQGGRGLAEGRGIRLSQRGGCLRPAVRPRAGPCAS